MDETVLGGKKIRQKEVAKTVRSGKYAEVGVNANRELFVGRWVCLSRIFGVCISDIADYCTRNMKKTGFARFYIWIKKTTR